MKCFCRRFSYEELILLPPSYLVSIGIMYLLDNVVDSGIGLLEVCREQLQHVSILICAIVAPCATTLCCASVDMPRHREATWSERKLSATGLLGVRDLIRLEARSAVLAVDMVVLVKQRRGSAASRMSRDRGVNTVVAAESQHLLSTPNSRATPCRAILHLIA